MKKRPVVYCLLCFLGGGIAFFVIMRIGVAHMMYGKPLPLRHPRTFADITVWTKKVPSVKDGITYDISNALFMSKSGIPFLTVYQDKDGNVAQLCIIDEKENILFSMAPTTEPGKWKRVTYCGYNEMGNMNGEFFLDINFDGRFDTKHVLNDAGEKISTYIFIDRIWKQVDSANTKIAISGQTTYVFDNDSGWKLNK